MAVNARRLGPDDLSACLRLDRLALKGLWTRQQWERELSENNRLVMGIDTEDRSLIALASGWLVLDELQIMAVAVDPMHQRRGFGARVLQSIIDRASCLGAVSATLEVAATNAAGRAFYAHSGFCLTGRRTGYYANGDDALLQSRSIGSGRDFRTDQTE
ncbi:ribosomal-protein-alanine N-acetyltransferase [Synechococcus sp. MIT S9509]|uniref:GNAT family N-acetyltransferase n=1 Tax=unclassified Synechococcus TaxID=2626047 RepID=UPI0007BB515D|nr:MULTISPECIES: GNAT family N-acetyltransferase [unclassified Synechococcus]KZR86760.1 ribosomal-protein-alanine N-acetyltransferase [Synechococcus sp. MIT S9509]KZR87588.1 ribosomal-protein-alanine N-acetyltransferase [Synechococcus sp. MIT S9504]